MKLTFNLSASITSLKWMIPHAEIIKRTNGAAVGEPVIVNHLPDIPPAGIVAIIIGSILVCALVAFFTVSLIRAKKQNKIKKLNTKETFSTKEIAHTKEITTSFAKEMRDLTDQKRREEEVARRNADEQNVRTLLKALPYLIKDNALKGKQEYKLFAPFKRNEYDDYAYCCYEPRLQNQIFFFNRNYLIPRIQEYCENNGFFLNIQENSYDKICIFIKW